MGMREKLIKLLDDFSAPVMLMDTKLMDWNIPTQQLREAMADHLIANGVMPVVRCKDCTNKRKAIPAENGQVIFCSIWGRGWCRVDPNDFCSYGERKDND